MKATTRRIVLGAALLYSASLVILGYGLRLALTVLGARDHLANVTALDLLGMAAFFSVSVFYLYMILRFMVPL